jgi:signal transduction histidine kinase
VVTGDRDRLAQALENLLANAVRHGTPPVSVAVETTADTVRIRVCDRGGGVTPAMQGRLFERFATGRSRGGTGLGLFIVRQLALAHGGDATYEPPTEQTPAGSFLISLPRASQGRAGDRLI